MDILRLASICTDPLCKVRENKYTWDYVDRVSEAVYLALETIAYACLAVPGAFLGMVLRGAFVLFSNKPYVYEKRGAGEQVFNEEKISIAFHNICAIPGGYCITDGGVMPSRERIERNLDYIVHLKPDVICLCEVGDIAVADLIAEHLPEYPYVIPMAGVRTFAPSFMGMVLSKYPIQEDTIDFTSFVRGEQVTGRSQYSGKGVLSFCLEGKKDVQILFTHLQHSEIPSKPTEDEISSRRRQMEVVAAKVDRLKNVIFTGDLNQDENELEALETGFFRRDEEVKGVSTWLGDASSAKIVKKDASGPQVLDYTLIAGEAESITTQIHSDYLQYNANCISKEAISDHALLFSEITLKNLSE